MYTDKLLANNLLGITGKDDEALNKLFKEERKFSLIVYKEIEAFGIKGNFDYEHLKKIHKELFKRVYSIAGQDRVDLGFKNISFGKVAPDGELCTFQDGKTLKESAKTIFNDLKKDNYLKDLNFDEFTNRGAEFFIKLNTLHPFIEGNGRTQRLFMTQLSKEAGYNLSFENVSDNDMALASSFAMFGNKRQFKEMFKACCSPLDKEQSKEQDTTTNNISQNNTKTQTTSLISQRLAACKEQQNSIKQDKENKNKSRGMRR
jgi:cell filamentation protein